MVYIGESFFSDRLIINTTVNKKRGPTCKSENNISKTGINMDS